MKTFVVNARFADFCGNVEWHEHAVVQARDIKDVQAVYPESPLVGFEVQELEFTPLPTTVQKPHDMRFYRNRL